jgi:hypothetical protein
MNVLVFKTTVETPEQSKSLKPRLDQLAGTGRWNFDLSDCDKILRIASPHVRAESTIGLLQKFGFACAELED